MASRMQIDANRENAKRSTGPKSQAGKARSRLNSRRHGLTATTLVIGGEDPTHFEELRAELMEQHDPRSALEFELVERLSGILWRLRRVPFFEAAILDARQAQVTEQNAMKDRSSRRPYEEPEQSDEDAETSDEEWSVFVGQALVWDVTFGDGLGKLARHEATLMNAFAKTLQILLLLQGNRQDEKASLIVEAVALPPKDR